MLSIVNFLVAIFVYPIVFATAGYMFSFSISLNEHIVIATLATLVVSNLFLKTNEIVFVVLDNFVLVPTLVINSFYNYDIQLIGYYLGFRIFFKYLEYFSEKIKLKRIHGIYPKKWIYIYPALFIYTVIIFKLTVEHSVSLNPIENYLNSYSTRANLKFEGLIGYFLNSLVFILLPIIMYFGQRKNIFGIVFVALLIISIYSIMPLTLYFMLMIAVIGFELLSRYSALSLTKLVQIALCMILLLSLFDISLLNMVINRFYFTIGVNNIFYYDFFSENNLYLFQNSKLGILFHSNNYSDLPGFIIDRFYYLGKGSNQSSGIFASAFANAGVAGLIVCIFLLVLIMRVIDISHEQNLAIKLKLLLGLALINFPLHQLLLTNGLLIYLILNILSKDENSPYNRLL